MYAIKKRKTKKYNELLKKFQVKLNDAIVKNDTTEQNIIKLLMNKIKNLPLK